MRAATRLDEVRAPSGERRTTPLPGHTRRVAWGPVAPQPPQTSFPTPPGHAAPAPQAASPPGPESHLCSPSPSLSARGRYLKPLSSGHSRHSQRGTASCSYYLSVTEVESNTTEQSLCVKSPLSNALVCFQFSWLDPDRRSRAPAESTH